MRPVVRPKMGYWLFPPPLLPATMGKRASAVQGWMAWLLLKDQGYAGLKIRQKPSSLGLIFACQSPQVCQAAR